MFRNYLLIGLRSLRRNRQASLINLLGLSIGISSCLVMLLYVRYERSFDQFHAQAQALFRVLTIDEALGVTSNNVAITMPALAGQMRQELPEVVNSCRMSNFYANQVIRAEQAYNLDHLWLAEPSFLDMFDFPLQQGQRAGALDRPNTALLSASTALRIFQRTDVVGEIVEINDQPVEITGVLADAPEQSHLQYDLILSMKPTQADSGRIQFLNGWNMIAMVSYVQLSDPDQAPKVQAQMEEMIRQHDVGPNFSVTLQPFEDIHLGSSDIVFDSYNIGKTDGANVNALLMVAIFVLLIAAFNYMNLATAQAAGRAKEVGLRKVVGASRQQLIQQFLTETVLLCLLGLLLGLGAAALFGNWLELPMPDNPLLYLLHDPPFLISVLLGTVLLGVLAGSYPAFVLSSFVPTKVLKGNFASSSRGLWLRRALVILQFGASSAMIVCTVVVFQQLNLLQSKDKGFDPDQIITINLNSEALQSTFEALQQQLRQLPGVQAIASSNGMPGQGYGRNGITPEGYEGDEPWIVSVTSINEDYIPLMGMKLVAGRNFSPEFATDSQQSVLINESMARALGWEGEAVGKTIQSGQPFRVVGVVGDYHFNLMKHQIEPLMMFYQPGVNYNLSVKLDAERVPETMAAIETIWTGLVPGAPFEYTFFDEEFARQFESERAFSRLVLIFTWLAIFIACLGLLGLSAYASSQRTKEIGVRKVLGASIPQLIRLLSREMMALVLTASLLAMPLAWYFLQDWLQGYYYRIDMPWWVYPWATVAALLIAFGTNAVHAVRTARANPIEALRYE